jgi:hypothetical protein
MSFIDFTKSTTDSGTLAQTFLFNYEKPANQDQPNRSTQAENWYTILTNSEPVKTIKHKMPLYMYKII